MAYDKGQDTKGEDILTQAKRRFKESSDGLMMIRDNAAEDLRFINGEQWPEQIKKDREADGRPCLVIDKLPAFVDQVVGDQRQNRPAIKVRPVDSEADPDTADVFTGLIRNIEQISQADVAYDTAFEVSVTCGMGFFRVVTEYNDDDVFEQDIKIKRISNPFTVYWDPNSQEIDFTDAQYMFVTQWMPRREYNEKYPDKPASEFNKAEKDNENWVGEDRIRIAEYFCKKPYTKTIWQADTGMVIDSTRTTEEQLISDGVEIVQSRQVKTYQIQRYLMTAHDILEGPDVWPSKYFPIVPVWGKELNIEGNRILRGLVRHAKDPQRLYNYNRSLGAEVISLAPKAPYLATPKQIEGHEQAWQKASKRNYPYLLYNPDPQMPGKPDRQIPNMLQTGIQNEVMVSDQELHDTTGLPVASLGERSNEKSGRAIIARQKEGDVSTFAYIDNLARSLTLTGKILVDLIPKIYDTARTIRTLGEDGSVRNVEINQGKNDVTVGKYDVAVTVGPSYTTQRQESAESMMDFMKIIPDAGPIIGDLVVKNMDWPGAQEISERLQKLLPPGLAEQEDEEGQGVLPPGGIPPEATAPPPDPTLEIKLEQEKVKLDQEEVKLEGMRLENKLKQAQIDEARSSRGKKKD